MKYNIHFSREMADRFTGIELSEPQPVYDDESFNRLCTALVKGWSDDGELKSGKPLQFSDVLAQGEAANPTPWGAVLDTVSEGDYVEKYLAVKRNGWLPLEKHNQKHETIAVDEGLGVLLYRPAEAAAGELHAAWLKPDAAFTFEPGVEHCIIGIQDVLVYEVSTDPLKEEDLIFIFNSRC